MTLTFTIEISMYEGNEPRFVVYENHGETKRNGVLCDDFETKWTKDFYTLDETLEAIKKRTALYEQLYKEVESVEE